MQRFKVLLLDDDPLSQSLLECALLDRFPALDIEKRNQPDPWGEHDLYFIDNDFNGQLMAVELARQIREEDENAMIIAFSSTLDAEILQQLTEAGCSGACDKSIPSDLVRAMDIAKCYLQAAAGFGTENGEAIAAVSELLQAWNSRFVDGMAA